MKEPSSSSSAEIKIDRIAPTAWIVAFRRTLTDIPYSQEIFDEFERMRQERGQPPISEELKTPQIAPQIEARYKMINRLIRDSKITQIFEMASGISPRGLQFTDTSKIEYIETDLSDMIVQKQAIVEAIKQKLKINRQNLHLSAADAMDLESLKVALLQFDPSKPVAVVNEGLLRYLSFTDKARVAGNVKTILKSFGGVWITPDITLKRILNSENMAAIDFNRINALTGINVTDNSFDNVNQAQKFFEDLGFTVEIHSWLEVASELTSPARLNQDREVTNSLIEPGYAFVMHVA